MPVKPPSHMFRVEHVEVTRIEKEKEPIVRTEIKTVEVIKEVEKIVFRDDPGLLLRLNQVLKENGELRQKLAKPNLEPLPRPELKLVEVIKEAPQPQKDFKTLLMSKVNYVHVSASLLIGGLLCYLTLK